MAKVAILSHVLPPSGSGQAIVLYRLLASLPPDYYMIGHAGVNHCDAAATSRLKTNYYELKIAPGKLLPIPTAKQARFLPLQLVFSIYERVAGVFNELVGGMWLLYSRARQIQQIVRQDPCDAVIAATGDLYDLPAAYVACKREGIALVPYIFDYYSQQWTGLRRQIARLLEPVCLKSAKAIIVTNEYMAAEYKKLYGVESTIIHNPAALVKSHQIGIERVLPENTINLVYVGAVYHAHFDAFRDMIEAIEKLGRRNVQFHIFTNQRPDWLAFHGIAAPTVTMHPHLPLNKIEGVLQEADVLFLGLAFESGIDLVIQTSSPGKLGDYLSSGRPILVHAPPDSFVSRYFHEHQCGIVVDTRDTNVLAQALEEILAIDTTQIVKRALVCADEDYGLPQIHVRFKHLLKTLSNENSIRRNAR